MFSSFTEAEARTTMKQEFSRLFAQDGMGGWLGRGGKGENNCFKCYSVPGAAPALLPALGCRYGSLLFSPSAKSVWKTPVAVPWFNLFSCADASVSLWAYKLDQRTALFFLTFFFNSSDPVYSMAFETSASAPLRQRWLWHSTRTKRLGGEQMTSQASFADEESIMESQPDTRKQDNEAMKTQPHQKLGRHAKGNLSL